MKNYNFPTNYSPTGKIHSFISSLLVTSNFQLILLVCSVTDVLVKSGFYMERELSQTPLPNSHYDIQRVYEYMPVNRRNVVKRVGVRVHRRKKKQQNKTIDQQQLRITTPCFARRFFNEFVYIHINELRSQ